MSKELLAQFKGQVVLIDRIIAILEDQSIDSIFDGLPISRSEVLEQAKIAKVELGRKMKRLREKMKSEARVQAPPPELERPNLELIEVEQEITEDTDIGSVETLDEEGSEEVE